MKLEEVLPALRKGEIIKSEYFLYKLYKESLYKKYIDGKDWMAASFSGYEFFLTDFEIFEEPKCELCNGLNSIRVVRCHTKEELLSTNNEGNYAFLLWNCPECCK